MDSPPRQKVRTIGEVLSAYKKKPDHMVFRSGDNVLQEDGTGYDQVMKYKIAFFAPLVIHAANYSTHSKHNMNAGDSKRAALTFSPIYMYQLKESKTNFPNTDNIEIQYLIDKYSRTKENNEHFPFIKKDRKWIRNSSNSTADYEFFDWLGKQLEGNSPGVISGTELILFVRPGSIVQRWNIPHGTYHMVLDLQGQTKSASFRF
jgi:hypothetical protein